MNSPAANRLLAVLAGQRVDPPPFWFMRQAGRYLPEYRRLRREAGAFLDLVYDPARAAEVTLQPVRRLGCDAAILFSDILVVPHALGQPLSFEAGEGPRLDPVCSTAEIARLGPLGSGSRIEAVYDTVARVRAALPSGTALIGFCGGLWTVATYMIAGRGGDDQAAAKRLAYAEPETFRALLDRLEEASAAYLLGQVQAGAQALQIFDSWAGQLPEPAFEAFILAPTRRLVRRVKAEAPEVPIIGFPRGAGGLLGRYASETGVDAIALDTGVAPAFANASLPEGLPVQGNLDPQLAAVGGEAMTRDAERILEGFSTRPHIFNLGHGFVPDTPVAHVEALAKMLRSWRNSGETSHG